ncbi:MAG: type IX secretion system membrane protein PorP/SprF [Prevotella sp.]|nr:type IX secretion system membrane protein PorP/SprF [Prevotella sp.]
MLKRVMIILSWCLSAISANAQYDPVFSHYWAMESSFNPASVGKESKLNVVGGYALSMVGYERNPKTMYIGADMPFYFARSYHGVGLSILNDDIGLFTHQRLSAQYAYRFKFLRGRLAVGLQGGVLMEKFDGSKVDLDEDDPLFTKTDISGNKFDLGLGLYYTRGRWYVGVSGQHLTSPKVSLGETNELNIDATYYFTAGYNIKLRNPFLTIPTSTIVRYDGHDYRADIGARLVYTHEKRMLYGGLSYSPEHSVTATIGGNLHGINVGYSYEMYTSGMKPGNGSHELFVSYQTDINLQKKGRNKHKSVRYL